MAERKDISRREFFKRLFPGLNRDDAGEESIYGNATPFDVVGENVVAVIQGKYCLTYEDIPCSKCYDRCPIEGAIVVEDGLPIVDPEVCTGCRVCKEVCPESADAILMVKAN
jgi:ferredoxin